MGTIEVDNLKLAQDFCDLSARVVELEAENQVLRNRVVCLDHTPMAVLKYAVGNDVFPLSVASEKFYAQVL